MRRLVTERPGLRLLVAGVGDTDELAALAGPELTDHIVALGKVSDAEKASLLRSVDAYCAPNTGGESFGIILTEAMSAGTPVVASDLEAFGRVLDGGTAGLTFPVGDSAALAERLGQVLDEPELRTRLARRGREVVTAFDWPVVAEKVVRVYETVIAADPRAVSEAE